MQLLVSTKPLLRTTSCTYHDESWWGQSSWAWRLLSPKFKLRTILFSTITASLKRVGYSLSWDGGEQPSSQGTLSQMHPTTYPLCNSLYWFSWPLSAQTVPGPYPTYLSKIWALKEYLATHKQPTVLLIFFFLSSIDFPFPIWRIMNCNNNNCRKLQDFQAEGSLLPC